MSPNPTLMIAEILFLKIAQAENEIGNYSTTRKPYTTNKKLYTILFLDFFIDWPSLLARSSRS